MPAATGSEEPAQPGRALLRRLQPGRTAAAAALGILAVAVFIPAFTAAFVWDDVIIVDLADHVDGLADIWLNPSLIESEGHYWPVVYTTFWVEHLLWGADPVGYHVVNVLIHAANSVLILTLLRRLGAPGAWAAAAIFAVHPVHVDSVVWAIERKDVLSALFYLLSALAYMHWDEQRRTARPGRQRPGRPRRGEAAYLASLAAFALGLLSKSIVVTLPVMLLVYHWWRDGRVRRRELARTAPFFAVAAAITAGDLAYYTSRESVSLDISLPERAQIVSRSFWHYAQKLLWPDGLLPIHPRWDVDGGDPLGWVLLLAGVAAVAGAWALRRRAGRGVLAAVLFFGVTLSPALGVVDYGYMDTSYVADRFQYLAGIGLIALVVGAAASAASAAAARLQPPRWLDPGRVLAGLCVLVVAVLGVLTWRLSLNYASPEKFFTHIVTNNPTARGGAYTNLGNAYREQGRPQEAIAMYEQSLINDAPNVVLPLYNLGVTYGDEGDAETAESFYRRSLELNSKHVPSLSNLAVLLAEQRRFDEAEELTLRALRHKPHDARVLGNAALLYAKLEDFATAEDYYARGVQRHPEDDGLLSSYGLFLVQTDRLVEAEPVLRRALSANPRRQDVAQSLADVLVALGRDDEAAALVEAGHIESLARSAANAEVERGNDLLEAGQLTRAVEAYEAALAAHPDHVAALVQLAVALENLDRHEEALARYRQAHEIDDQDISAVYFLALLSARLERHEQALELFDAAEQIFEDGLVPVVIAGADLPERADVHLNRGVVLVGLGRLEDALADIDRALELDPGLELAAWNREQILGMIDQRDRQGG